MPTENRLPSTEPRCPNSNTGSSASPECPAPPSDWRPGVFDHHRLDAYVVAREALIRGDATLRALIAEGRWHAFRTEQLQSARTLFETHLRQRLQQAMADGRLDAQHVAALVDIDGPTATDLAA